DAVWWNSRFNRDSFLRGLPRFLRQLPDEREPGLVSEVESLSTVMPLGLDLGTLAGDSTPPRGGRPRVIWNHRWEHDKEPEGFDSLRNLLGDRLVQFGFVADRREYGAWLRSGDVVVSTARQEFFGAAVWEAVWCGCRPVLPDRLAYPELVPPEYHAAVLYEGSEALVDLLAVALGPPDRGLVTALGRHVAAFDWDVVAPRYDDALAAHLEA
ncbi:MAG: DUF3524 domain-containing protein, partial [Anaerolineae bacterium]